MRPQGPQTGLDGIVPEDQGVGYVQVGGGVDEASGHAPLFRGHVAMAGIFRLDAAEALPLDLRAAEVPANLHTGSRLTSF